jgi:hypothetical protein
MNYARFAPLTLIDTDGEGIYLLSEWEEERPFSMNPIKRAMRIFECDRDELDVESVAFILDGEDWRRVGFKNWRWMLPWWRPAIYLYCQPLPDPEEDGGGKREEKP